MEQRRDPTPAEIAAMCEEIRESWSPETLASRTAIGPTPWQVPGSERNSETITTRIPD